MCKCPNDTVGNTKTTIDAQNLGNALYIGTDDIVFEMSGFVLTNGHFQIDSNALGGAVSLTGGMIFMYFTDMLIQNSSGLGGGGIMINPPGGGSNNFVVLENTLISHNTAAVGGGVYCYNSVLYVADNSGVVDNHTTADSATDWGQGGGLYLKGCLASFFGGPGLSEPEHLVGISNNSATGSGGGIYADNSIIRTQDGPAEYDSSLSIDHNTANTDLNAIGDGGGVYLLNSGIDIYRLFIHDNKVVNGHGGGLYLDDSIIGSETDSPSYNSCYANGHTECNLFADNSAIASLDSPLPGFSSYGGAIYMFESGMSAEGDSLRARFINNSADYGSALLLADSTLDVQGSYFINNVAQEDVFAVFGGSVLNLNFSTVANNFSNHVFRVATASTVNLFGSIIYEAFAFNIPILTGDGTFDFGCSIFHENDSIGFVSAIGGSTVSQNPGFISEETGNYHLRYDSIAIDRCSDGGLTNLAKDIDLDIRGLDFPGVNNGFQGNYDAGADEVKVNDLIFADGFEM